MTTPETYGGKAAKVSGHSKKGNSDRSSEREITLLRRVGIC